MPICVHICFHATELSIWDRCVTHEAYIYYLALYRNGLLTPGLNHGNICFIF